MSFLGSTSTFFHQGFDSLKHLDSYLRNVVKEVTALLYIVHVCVCVCMFIHCIHVYTLYHMNSFSDILIVIVQCALQWFVVNMYTTCDMYMYTSAHCRIGNALS